MAWVGPAIGAAGAIAGGVLGNSSAKKAAKAQEKASNQANALAYQQYQQARTDQAPARYVGNQALNMLAGTYGLDQYNPGMSAPQGPSWDQILAGASKKERTAMTNVVNKLGYNPFMPNTGGGGSYNIANPGAGQRGAPNTVSILTDPTAPAAQPGNYNAFFASPDYNFRKDQQQQALDRSNSAKGMVLSGAQQKATARYSGDLASGEFGNWYNHVASLANVGQTATNNLQNAGSTYSGDAQRNTLGAGDARASGYLGQANSIGNAISGVANAAGSYYANKMQSNPTSATSGYTNPGSNDFLKYFNNYRIG